MINKTYFKITLILVLLILSFSIIIRIVSSKLLPTSRNVNIETNDSLIDTTISFEESTNVTTVDESQINYYYLIALISNLAIIGIAFEQILSGKYEDDYFKPRKTNGSSSTPRRSSGSSSRKSHGGRGRSGGGGANGKW